LGAYVSTSGFSGSFIIGDQSTATVMTSTETNQFRARFDGGYQLFSNNSLTTGVSLAPGGGAWVNLSDKNKKENFCSINTEDILVKVGAIPLSNWNYKAQDKSIRHIGPLSQDFFAAFHLDGESDTTINTLDIDGINMAAIQALLHRTDELKKKTAELDAAITNLEILRDELHSLKAEVAAMKYQTGIVALEKK